jgi:hypothetical protein
MHSPAQPLGVNAGESLGIIFNFMPGETIPDVVDEQTSGELRVGIHVQGFAFGGSESFVNVPVPEPTGLALFAAAAGVLARRRVR